MSRSPVNTYQAVPGIADRIRATLAELRLTPVDPEYTPERAIGHRARYYMTPAHTPRRSVVWFKATLQQDAHLRRALREEIRVQKLFVQYERRARPSFDSPSYIAHRDDGRKFLWLVRRYWDGMFAGDMSEWYGFSPAFFRAVRPEAMAKILADVRGMSAFMRRRNPLESHQLGWYMLDFHYYEREFLRPMVKNHPAPDWNRGRVDLIAERLLSARKFLSTHSRTFTHGDMYPTNIMIRSTARRPVVLFDWELSHLNVPTFDAVMVYLHAWRRPRWQKEFRQQTVASLGDTPTTHQAWKLATLSIAVRLAGFCYIRIHHLQPDRYPRLRRSDRPILERWYRVLMVEINRALE